MKLSWFNTSMGTYKLFLAYEYVQYEAMQDIREIELRNSGSNTNNKIYFEVRVTALRPRLHTEGFSLYVHTRPPPKGTSIEEFAIIKLEYTTPLSNTTTSNQEARHKAKTQSPLHKRHRHKAKLQSPLHKRDKGIKLNLNHNHLHTRGIATNPKQRRDYKLGDHNRP